MPWQTSHDGQTEAWPGVYTFQVNRPNTPNIKYVVTLAVAAGLILLGGAILRPRTRSTEQPSPTDSDLARLVRLTERRALDSATALLNQVADDAAPAVVWLDAAGTSGVVWTATTIATAPASASGSAPLATTVAGPVTAARTDWSPDLPVASVAMADATRAQPPPRSAPPAQTGAPVLAVWRNAQSRLFAPAAFVERAEETCGDVPSAEVRTTLTFTPAMAGGGLFDLDGGLLGLIVPCGDRYAAVVPEVIDRLLVAVASFESRLLARYGLVVAPPTDEESAFFAADAGVIVREVRAGGPAAAAGLRPGDIVVGLDGAAVTRVDDLEPLTATPPVAEAVFSLRRASAALDVRVGESAATPAPPDAGTAGVVWEAPRRGFLVEAVRPGSRAAAAGIESGDRVIRIGNDEPKTLDQVRRALVGRTAVFVELERAGRRRGVLVAPEVR